MKLKVAVVGCGLIATRKFLPILGRLRSRADLVAICDLDEKTLATAAAAFPGPKPYSDLAALLAGQSPDVVVVCTPPRAHLSVVNQALRAGAHVLVEKPMALTSAECREMVDTASACGRRLGVMHNQAFNPGFEAACDLVTSGGIGQFLGMRVLLMTSVHDMMDDPQHWAHRLPGGISGETAPHAVYLSLALLDRVRDVRVHTAKRLKGFEWAPADDIRIDLIAENGTSSILLEYGSRQTAGEVDIIGSQEVLRVDLQTRVMTRQRRPVEGLLIPSGVIAGSVVNHLWETTRAFARNSIVHSLRHTLDGHYVGVKRFLDHAETGSEYRATGDKGQEVVAIGEEIAAQIKRGLNQ